MQKHQVFFLGARRFFFLVESAVQHQRTQGEVSNQSAGFGEIERSVPRVALHFPDVMQQYACQNQIEIRSTGTSYSASYDRYFGGVLEQAAELSVVPACTRRAALERHSELIVFEEQVEHRLESRFFDLAAPVVDLLPVTVHWPHRWQQSRKLYRVIW